MFDPVRICEVLNEEGVRYVVVGGIATVMHGSSLATRDLDIVPDRSRENLENLARALGRIDARIRTGDDAIEARIDATFLAGSTFMLNLTSEFGDLDLAFSPAGPNRSFDDWLVHASHLPMSEGLMVWVGSLDDLIDSKRAANRPKDIAALPLLESLRDQSTD